MATERVCIHNIGVTCADSRCSIKCGWNPRGETARKKALRSGNLTQREDGIRRLVVKKGAAHVEK